MSKYFTKKDILRWKRHRVFADKLGPNPLFYEIGDWKIVRGYSPHWYHYWFLEKSFCPYTHCTPYNNFFITRPYAWDAKELKEKLKNVCELLKE